MLDFVLTAFEGLIVAVLLAVVALAPPVRRVWNGLSLPYRFACLALPALLLAGHLAGRNAATFPFVSWTMYSERVLAPRPFYRYTGRTAAGAWVPFAPTHALPSLDRERLHTKLARQIRKLEAPGDPGEKRAARLRHHATLRYLLRRFNRQRGEAPPLRALTVSRCTVPLPYDAAAGARCDSLWDVSLNSPAPQP